VQLNTTASENFEQLLFCQVCPAMAALHVCLLHMFSHGMAVTNSDCDVRIATQLVHPPGDNPWQPMKTPVPTHGLAHFVHTRPVLL
jgi:hypothetical protein